MAAITHPADGHAAHHDDHHSHDDHGPSYATTLRFNRLGLWLFFLSEVFLFGGLLAARFYLWRCTDPGHWECVEGALVRPELDQFVGLIVTVVLLLSSWSMNMGETAIEHGDRRTFNIGFISTFILGTIFLFGVMIFEWGLIRIPIDMHIFTNAGHIKPWDGAFGAVIFAMTGMHALHVLSGLAFIAVVWNRGRKGQYTPEEHWGVEACAIYWHYVDLVWIFFYPALYLIGAVVHGAH